MANPNNNNSEPGFAEYGIILGLVFAVVVVILLGFFGLIGSAILGIFGIQLGILPTAGIGAIAFYGGRRWWRNNKSSKPTPISSRGHVSSRMDDTTMRGQIIDTGAD